MIIITDNDIGDLLETTLTDMYGTAQVKAMESGVWYVSANGKEATVTRHEVTRQTIGAASFVALLKKKFGL